MTTLEFIVAESIVAWAFVFLALAYQYYRDTVRP